jgi:hypothetical protein
VAIAAARRRSSGTARDGKYRNSRQLVIDMVAASTLARPTMKAVMNARFPTRTAQLPSDQPAMPQNADISSHLST